MVVIWGAVEIGVCSKGWGRAGWGWLGVWVLLGVLVVGRLVVGGLVVAGLGVVGLGVISGWTRGAAVVLVCRVAGWSSTIYWRPGRMSRRHAAVGVLLLTVGATLRAIVRRWAGVGVILIVLGGVAVSVFRLGAMHGRPSRAG